MRGSLPFSYSSVLGSPAPDDLQHANQVQHVDQRGTPQNVLQYHLVTAIIALLQILLSALVFEFQVSQPGLYGVGDDWLAHLTVQGLLNGLLVRIHEFNGLKTQMYFKTFSSISFNCSFHFISAESITSRYFIVPTVCICSPLIRTGSS